MLLLLFMPHIFSMTHKNHNSSLYSMNPMQGMDSLTTMLLLRSFYFFIIRRTTLENDLHRKDSVECLSKD